MSHLLFLVLLCGSTGNGGLQEQARKGSPQLWFYVKTNLSQERSARELEGLIARAETAGYTGMVLNDWASGVAPYLQGEALALFRRNLPRILRCADEHKQKVVLSIFDFGWSGGILYVDKNLAEGQPVKGAEFTVAQDRTSLLFTPSSRIEFGGGFERLTGWSLQDGSGTRLHLDSAVAHGGANSLRIDGGKGPARAVWTLPVQPWRQYHVRFWLRTEKLTGRIDVQLRDHADPSMLRHYLPDSSVVFAETQDWMPYDFVSNSATSTSLDLVVGVPWGPTSGTAWMDDLQMEETALINVVRRSGAPLRLYDANRTATTYVEGTDFHRIADPRTNERGPFDEWHSSPTVTLDPKTSRLAAGQRVNLDYYAVEPTLPSYTMRDGAPALKMSQVGACLTEPAIQDYMTKTMDGLKDYSRMIEGYLLNYDEMRHMITCESCVKKGKSAGRLLAWHLGQSVATVRKVHANAPIYLWNDMFDPHHNARDRYYFVGTGANGDIRESWSGMSRDMIVFNWNHVGDRFKDSLKFFAERRNPQIIAGYYDSHDGKRSASAELEAARGIPGIVGMMYTTWNDDYAQLEAYADAVRTVWNR